MSMCIRHCWFRFPVTILALAACALATWPSTIYAIDLPPHDHFRLWQLPTKEERNGGMYVGMSYVIQGPTGHLAVIDGGWRSDATDLKNLLHDLGGHVDAWFITHQHPDHIGALTTILEDMSNPCGVQLQIGQVYASPLSDQWIQRYASKDLAPAQAFNAALVAGGKSIIEPSLGQEIVLDGLTFKILSLADESGWSGNLNDQSMAIRLSSPGTSVLFLGDLGLPGGKRLLAGEFADQVGSEYVQMSHHGNNGVGREVYEVVGAKYALWPTPQFLWDAPPKSVYDTAKIRKWMNELGIQKHYVMKDGLIRIDLPFKQSNSSPPKVTAGRHVFGNKDILISKLEEAVDRDLLQKNPKETNLWKVVSYVCDECAGMMLGEGGHPDMKPVAIHLQAKGRYRIFLGLYGGLKCRQMRVRLSGDAASDTLPIQVDGDWEQRSTVICETFWKEADLTGRDLILEGSGDAGSHSGALAYVRLEAIPERKEVYPLAITNDGYAVGTVSRPEDLLKKLEGSVPEGTPLRIFFWSTGCADNCNFPTKVGQFYPNAGLSYGPGEWQNWARNMGIWKEEGWNSLQLVRDYAHKRKWEFQVYIRMQAFRAPFPFDAQENSAFFNTHPQYHCLDRTGQRVNRLSYAYPEVQEYVIRLIKEIADYDPDGVCLCFIRGVPLVLFEPIMVEGFKKQYGLDPRDLDALDPRWMDYQCAVLTSFIKQAKKALKPNQRLSVIVPGNELDCRRWGLDVADWVKESLVDDLLPTGQRFDAYDVHRDDPDNLNFPYFARLEGRERIRLIPVLYPWKKFHADFASWEQLMRSYLDWGADAYCIWDGGGMSWLAKTQNIGSTMKNYRRPPPPAFREVKLRSLQGFRMDRYHYGEVI